VERQARLGGGQSGWWKGREDPCASVGGDKGKAAAKRGHKAGVERVAETLVKRNLGGGKGGQTFFTRYTTVTRGGGNEGFMEKKVSSALAHHGHHEISGKLGERGSTSGGGFRTKKEKLKSCRGDNTGRIRPRFSLGRKSWKEKRILAWTIEVKIINRPLTGALILGVPGSRHC